MALTVVAILLIAGFGAFIVLSIKNNDTVGGTADSFPPIVSTTIPANASIDVAVNSIVHASFNETMNSSTITNATFTLTHGGLAVEGSVTYSDLTASFNPEDDLMVNTTYNATITTGVKDLAGNALSVEYKWNFTTANHLATPISIIDDRGVNVTLTNYPQRILSLGTAFTECLYAIGAQDQIAGVDSTSKYPTDALNKTNIGSGYSLNLENVTMLQPDLVIMWKSYTTSLTSLTHLNMTVIALDPQSVVDVENMISKLGNVTGKTHGADSVVTDMKARVAVVQLKLANVTYRPNVYMELLSSGGKSPGPGTMTDNVIGLAGGNNINTVTTSRYTKLDNEYVVNQNPDFIILEKQNTKTDEQVKNTPGYGAINAVVNDTIMRVDGAWLTASPRIVLAVETFAQWFHPELFPT